MTVKKKKIPAAVRHALRDQALGHGHDQPDLTRLVMHFFGQAGGESGVAKLLFDEFAAAKTGSIVRQRIMDLIIRALKTSNELVGVDHDLSHLTEEEIDRELDSLIEKEAGGVIDRTDEA